MKWYGIVAFLVLIGGLAGIVVYGMNPDKIGVDFGTPSFISNQITSTTSIFGYDIDSPCDLAIYLKTADTSTGAYFDVSDRPLDNPDNVKKLQNLVYSKYEKWEVEAGYYNKEVAEIKRDFVYNLETEYALKKYDINPKFYNIVDKGIHIMASRTFDQDKVEISRFTHMLNANMFGEDNSCERKYLETYGNQTYEGLKTIHSNNMQQVDAVWNEIQSRVYDCNAEVKDLVYTNCRLGISVERPSTQWNFTVYERGIIDDEDPRNTTLFSLDLIIDSITKPDFPDAEFYLDIYDWKQTEEISIYDITQLTIDHLENDPFSTNIELIYDDEKPDQFSMRFTILGDQKYECYKEVNRKNNFDYYLIQCINTNPETNSIDKLTKETDAIFESFKFI